MRQSSVSTMMLAHHAENTVGSCSSFQGIFLMLNASKTSAIKMDTRLKNVVNGVKNSPMRYCCLK
jgi:hypothetical protein